MSATQSAPAKSSSDSHPILFQQFFKSVGPRTYAAQVKKASNGNHYLVLTEGKRDQDTNEVRKTRLFIFGEDFVAFFRMLHETAQFIRTHPVPPEIRAKREKMWNRMNSSASNTPNAGQREEQHHPTAPMSNQKTGSPAKRSRPATRPTRPAAKRVAVSS